MLFLGRSEEEDSGGSLSETGDIGENKKIWSVIASKHAKTNPEHEVTKSFRAIKKK